MTDASSATLCSMEPFRFTPQTIAFVALMAAVTVVVAVAAPFGSIALAVVALLGIGVVLIKAMLRTRRWWPLTAVEGTVALSGVVLVVGGLTVMAYSMFRLGTDHARGMMVGWPSMADGQRPQSITRSVSYGDPETQQRLKDGLRSAGVPFTVKMQDGKEFVGWDAQHAAAAQAVDEKIKYGPLPSGRNVHFPDPNLRKQFTDWLAQKGIQHEIVTTRGQDYVVWNEDRGDLAREFIESRSADCKAKVVAGKSASC
jgi:hypothetical protein